MKKEYTPKKVSNNLGGRRIAIGDIHGCYHTLVSLIQNQLKINKNDQIFLLGDIIDKGNDSALVLDLIIDLQKKGYQIFPLKGNHEEQLLLAYKCGFDFFEDYLKKYNSLDLLGNNLNTYLDLIHTFDYCIELDQFVLSHCGINTNRVNPFTDIRGMFPNVNFCFEEKELISKVQIHGHLVQSIVEIKNNVQQKKRKISIDSGCYLKEENFGFLTAIELDSRKLYFQKNEIND